MQRVIGHIDLDYFYAQVEEVQDPSLKDRPVVVCVFSGRTKDSGVVSTANYKAREFGVHSAMPIASARKQLEGKDPAIIPMNHEKYERISERVMDIVEKTVDILEPAGIDEAFFDLTSSSGGDFSDAARKAEAIKASIFKDEGLTCSIGLGKSKVVAKMGSDMSKPDGLTVILPERTEATIAPLPVTKLYGVGPKTAAILEEMAIRTIGQLAAKPLPDVEDRFGRKFGSYLSAAARGLDESPVVSGQEATQFSRIVTLKRDTRDPQEVAGQLSEGVEYLQGKLSASKKSFRTITAIGILTDLTTKTRSKTFEVPVSDTATMKETTLGLFQELSRSVGKDYRRAGIRVSGMSKIEGQSSLSDFAVPKR